jgi:hypothetical protein
MTQDDAFRPIKTDRLLATLVACPHCHGAVDVTLETHRARVEMIGLLWDAFWERGRAIEMELDELRVGLENEIVRRERGSEPIATFHHKIFAGSRGPTKPEKLKKEGSRDG